MKFLTVLVLTGSVALGDAQGRRSERNRTRVSEAVSRLNSRGRQCLRDAIGSAYNLATAVDRFELDDPTRRSPSFQQVYNLQVSDLDNLFRNGPTKAARLVAAFSQDQIVATAQALGLPDTVPNEVPTGLQNCSTEFGEIRTLINRVVDHFQSIPERTQEFRRSVTNRSGETFEFADVTLSNDGVCEFSERLVRIMDAVRTGVRRVLEAVSDAVCTRGAAFAQSEALRDLIVCVSNTRNQRVLRTLRNFVGTHVAGVLATLRNKCAARGSNNTAVPIRLRFRRRLRFRIARALSDNQKTALRSRIRTTVRAINNALSENDVNVTFTTTEVRRLEEGESVSVQVTEDDPSVSDYQSAIEEGVTQEGYDALDTEEEAITVDEFETVSDVEDDFSDDSDPTDPTDPATDNAAVFALGAVASGFVLLSV